MRLTPIFYLFINAMMLVACTISAVSNDDEDFAEFSSSSSSVKGSSSSSSQAQSSKKNVNANKVYDLAAQKIEIPHLNENYIFAPHWVEYEGQQVMNLAIEWIPKLRHSNWVAFSWDASTSQKNVARHESWTWDPVIPASKGSVSESDHKNDGYDKGHLCASADRLYSNEANAQTFYYSNISPQMSSLNNDFWESLESLLQKWGQETQKGKYDTVYVVKGGNTKSLLINFKGKVAANDSQYPTTDADGKTPKGLAVPSQYFAALLARKGDYYNSIAFSVPHSEDLPKNPSNAELKAYAISVDSLEVLTGLDFFCNLDDDIEDAVEAKLDVDSWPW